jgi:co-chaperonin GroES (HSP10)|tara:strand:+ start:79 stop:336 length:258 start_codon:yes stop_codon:yes gene_type:complete
MKPIGKHIAIEKIEQEVKTSSGLLLSSKDIGDMRYAKGRAVKVGTDVSVINDGDILYYDKSRSYTMIIEDKPYVIISERDVVVVL